MRVQIVSRVAAVQPRPNHRVIAHLQISALLIPFALVTSSTHAAALATRDLSSDAAVTQQWLIERPSACAVRQAVALLM